MYKARYNLKTIRNSKDNLETRATLRAKFSFRNEVAPKDLKNIIERLKFGRCEQLSGYLNKVEGLRYIVSGTSYTEYRDDSKYVTLKECLRSTNIRVCVKSKKAIALDKMFDLESFNKYVLTGQMDKPEKVLMKDEISF